MLPFLGTAAAHSKELNLLLMVQQSRRQVWTQRRVGRGECHSQVSPRASHGALPAYVPAQGRARWHELHCDDLEEQLLLGEALGHGGRYCTKVPEDERPRGPPTHQATASVLTLVG